MMLERYPNLKEEVGGTIPDCEISSLLDRNLPGGQLPHVLWHWYVGLMSLKKEREKKEMLLLKSHCHISAKIRVGWMNDIHLEDERFFEAPLKLAQHLLCMFDAHRMLLDHMRYSAIPRLNLSSNCMLMTFFCASAAARIIFGDHFDSECAPVGAKKGGAILYLFSLCSFTRSSDDYIVQSFLIH